MACQPPALTKTVSEQEAARWGIPSASARRMIDAGALQPQPEERSPSEQQAVLLIDGGATAGGGINESSPQTIDCPPPASPSTPRSPRASSRSRGLFCSLFACGVDEPPRPRDLGVPPPPPPRPPPPTPRPNESSSQAVSPAAAPRAPSPAAIAHTRVLWDIENVGCPRGESLDGLGVVTRLTEWLRAREPPLWGTGIDGCVTVFFCRGKSTVSAELERQLDKAAVEQVLVSDKREDADRKIVARLERDADNLLARDGGGGCAFVFITSDQDFRHQFQTGSRKGARVVVLHRAPSGSAHERALALHADEAHHFDAVLGLKAAEPNKKPARSAPTPPPKPPVPSGDNAKKDTGDAGGFVDALVVFISQKPDGRIGTAQLSEFYALPGGAAHRASKELFMPTGVGWAKFCAVGGKGFGRVVYAKDGTAPGGAWLATMELAATTLPRPKPPSPKGHSDGDHESTRAFVDALVLFISQKPDGRIGAAQLCEFYALPGGSDHRALKERHIPAGLRAFCAKGGAACGRIAHVQDSAAPGCAWLEVTQSATSDSNHRRNMVHARQRRPRNARSLSPTRTSPASVLSDSSRPGAAGISQTDDAIGMRAPQAQWGSAAAATEEGKPTVGPDSQEDDVAEETKDAPSRNNPT